MVGGIATSTQTMDRPTLIAGTARIERSAVAPVEPRVNLPAPLTQINPRRLSPPPSTRKFARWALVAVAVAVFVAAVVAAEAALIWLMLG
jgi:hypothetical protein